MEIEVEEINKPKLIKENISTLEHSAYQNLKIEQDNTKETNDDITKAFIKFIKEYRNGNIFKYR